MSYSVTCECGLVHSVSATDAGSTLRCRCGRSVDVPLLSSLRKSAGDEAFPLSTIERIRAMIRDGELPSGDICPCSGRPADDGILVHVQCERTWVRGGEPINSSKVLGCFLVFGWIGALIASLRMRPREDLGRDTSIQVPLRVSSDVRPKLLRMRQKALKAILRQTPVYAQLLDEFPEAEVVPIETT